MVVLGTGLLVAALGGPVSAALAAQGQALPSPVVNPHSTEICMNSRESYHGSWSPTSTDQMLANVLHAVSRGPMSEGPMTIYVATSQNVYIYDPASNSLILHVSGDQRSDATAGFEVGVSAGSMIDAGVAIHLGLLEAVNLWTGTASQLAACPRASATTWANAHWNPAAPIGLAASFGIRSVGGITSTLVAISSDGSLPNPSTDGPVLLDSVLNGLSYDSTFAQQDLSLNQISQLLWSSYGCSNHYASGKAGLVCASAVANYYLTRHVYAVSPDAVDRYHDRLPPGTDTTTRDHRIELVTSKDARAALRAAVPGLSDAPEYEVICLATAGDWENIEVGFAAIGAVLEARTLGLGGNVAQGFSSQVQSAIQAATGIPTSDLPMAIVSLGHPGTTGVAERTQAPDDLQLVLATPVIAGSSVAIRYSTPASAAVDLAIYDCLGRPVRTLVQAEQDRGAHSVTWDGRDDRGRALLSGVYFCRLKANARSRTVQFVVLSK